MDAWRGVFSKAGFETVSVIDYDKIEFFAL